MAKPNSALLYEIDLPKILAEFELPNGDDLLALQRRNIEAVRAANQLLVESIQSVMRSQSTVLRQVFEETGSLLSNGLHKFSQEEKLAKQSEMLQKAVEIGLSNMKEMFELAAKSNMDVASLIGKRTSDSLEEIRAKVAKIERG